MKNDQEILKEDPDELDDQMKDFYLGASRRCYYRKNNTKRRPNKIIHKQTVQST